MQPSEEIKSIVSRLYEKEALGTLFDFAKHIYSKQEGVIVIGTDPKDRYNDYAAISRFYELTSASVLEIRVDTLNAFSEGSVGWAVDQVTARLPSGIEIPVRHTYVFHQEGDGWKIVHTHISLSVPDESLGV